MSISVRVGASGLLLGLLAALVGWALQWAVDSRARATYDVPGSVTTIRLGAAPIVAGVPGSPGSDVAEGISRLRAFLRDQSLALVAASVGEGRPAMVVADPTHVLSWFPAETVGDQPTAYIFAGTYTAQRWVDSGVTPLVAEGVRIGGVITAPRGAGDLQFALALGSFQLPGGEYVVNTVDAAQLQQLLTILGQLGLEPYSSAELPLGKDLAQNPFFVTTSLLVGLGLLCAAMVWVVSVRSLHSELVIRRRHGATPLMLARQRWLRGLPSLCVGVLIGAAASGLVVVVVGREGLHDVRYGWLAATTLTGLILAALVWLAAVCIAVISGSAAKSARKA